MKINIKKHKIFWVVYNVSCINMLVTSYAIIIIWINEKPEFYAILLSDRACQFYHNERRDAACSSHEKHKIYRS
jgi:hypothetical protein